MSKKAPQKKIRVIGQGRFLRLVEEKGWEYVLRANCTGVVVIVAVTAEGKVLFTEQYRPAVKKRVIEFPAGLVGDEPGSEKENFLTAAKRELEEETGYRARRMKQLIQGPASSGLTSEQMTFLKADDLRKVGDGGGTETESIVVHAIKLSRVESWLKSMQKKGFLLDPKIYAGLYFLKGRIS